MKSEWSELSRCWVAAHMCVKSHFRTFHVRAEVRAERYLELCVRSACVWLVFDVRCAIALLNTFLKKMTRFSVLEHPFCSLEHLFLFSNILFLFLNILSCFQTFFFLFLNTLSCFRTAYSDLEHTKIC